jgi:hypothetical protein
MATFYCSECNIKVTGQTHYRSRDGFVLRGDQQSKAGIGLCINCATVIADKLGLNLP